MSRTAVAACLLCVVLTACDDELCPANDGHAEPTTPSGATCNGSTLDYDTFGKDFMTNYCTSCHSSSLKSEEERQCAPADHNFDSLDGVLLARDHIDEHAAAGPNGVNDEMPPSGSKMPTDQERMNLGIWLACEEERMPGP
jgi:uncharacterized membrane protein